MTYIEDKTERELVDDIGSAVIGTPSGLKAQFSSAELTRRLIVNIRDLNKTTSSYSRVILFFTVILVVFGAAQIGYIAKQTEYVEKSTRGDRIQQEQLITKAVKLCEGNPELLDSGLYDVATGKSASCAKVLDQYQ